MAPTTALAAADFLVSLAIEDDESDLLTNLKLQKLLYYAQGCHLAIFGEALFDDKIEAWDLGPVVPSAYHAFKPCGRQPIEDRSGSAGSVDDRSAEFLSVVSDRFGQYSASRLIKMTHAESPWQDSYQSGLNNMITVDVMKNYFVENWVEKDVIVPDDGYDLQFISQLKDAEKRADSLPRLEADEVVKWLETA